MGSPETYSVRYIARVGGTTQAYASDERLHVGASGGQREKHLPRRNFPGWIISLANIGFPRLVRRQRLSALQTCFAVRVWQDDNDVKDYRGSLEWSPTASDCVRPPLCPGAGCEAPKMPVSATNESLQCRRMSSCCTCGQCVVGCSRPEPWLKTPTSARPNGIIRNCQRCCLYGAEVCHGRFAKCAHPPRTWLFIL
jgi:hypothetical protein